MRYFIIAGEASGDLHASNLMRELLLTDTNAEFCFLGGDLMLAQGGRLVTHYSEMAFMGFWAVAKNAKKIMNNIQVCKDAIDNFRPDLVILVDYPSFNLRIASYVKSNSNIPVYYYISPKLWAWKRYRIKSIKKYVDRMFCIFPFELGFYKQYDYNVEYVGNPTAESVRSLCNRDEVFEDFCDKNKFSQKPIIAILPGSRKQEIAACLSKMINAASEFQDYQIVISGAPGLSADYYDQFSSLSQLPVLFDQTYQLVLHAKVAIVNSGTATLETALIGTPQVVVYHLLGGRLAYWVKNIIIKTKYISLVNILAKKEIVKELIAHLFTEKNIVNELDEILNNKIYRQTMLKEYSEIETELGDSVASQKTAALIQQFLKEKTP
jgi:lipid-A-disaccharide synthase